MHFSKYLFWHIMVFGFFYSCQDDDVCVDELTPRLTVVFLDSLGEKQILDSIFVDYIDEEDNRVRINTIDSANIDSLQITIPNQSSPIKFVLYRSTTSGISDELQLNFTKELIFVSKACGFAYQYSGVSFSSTNNLIASITPNTEEIRNEQASHLFITY